MCANATAHQKQKSKKNLHSGRLTTDSLWCAFCVVEQVVQMNVHLTSMKALNHVNTVCSKCELLPSLTLLH